MSDIKAKFKLPKSQAEKRMAAIIAERDMLKAQVELPFLHGLKWYKWARAFYNSKNKINLLTAANQIGKSTTQIRRCIDHATNREIWPELWSKPPTQFWALYPTRDQVDAEWETKWLPLMPRGAMKEDPIYGWRREMKNQHLSAIHWKSGVHLYFKTYAQDAGALQSGTCDEIFADEEVDVKLFDELMFRLSATNGYYNMVFTATTGQEFWRRAMEPASSEEENLPEAFKQTISLYDAMEFDDGTPSHWTLERIKAVERRCSTSLEVLKRVYGRFVISGGRKYESFDIKRHFKEMPKHRVPKGWLVYVGADPGGGGSSHPSAICYVAVSPDFRKGRVFLGWRGDGIVTTSGDLVNKHIELTKEYKLEYRGRYYDWGNKDFYTIAQRMGHFFEPADKSHEKGEDVLNTLFKNDMLFIYEDDELRKLGAELACLQKEGLKRTKKDDFADALRYAVTKIPWDWTAVMEAPPPEAPAEELTDIQKQLLARRTEMMGEEKKAEQSIEEEFEEWNEAYEGY